MTKKQGEGSELEFMQKVLHKALWQRHGRKMQRYWEDNAVKALWSAHHYKDSANN